MKGKILKGQKPYKHMQKLLFVVVVTMIALTVVVSADTVYVKQLEEFDVKRPCWVNGTYCTTNTACNLSIVYPAGGLLVDNGPMTNQVAYHNYTISGFDNAGTHPSTMSCCDGSLCGADNFDIEVTSTGRTENVFPMPFIFLILGFVAIGMGKIFPQLGLFKTLGAILLMVLGTITLFPGYAGIDHTTLLGLAVGSISAALGFFFLVEDALTRFGYSGDRPSSDYEGVYYD